VPSRITGNNVEVRRQKIDDLSLPFVTPLGADNDQIGHMDELLTAEYSRNHRTLSRPSLVEAAKTGSK
jgi:hypothetical protein